MKGLLFLFRRRPGRALKTLAAGLVVNVGMALLTPLFLRHLFDRCVAQKDMTLLAGLLAFFAVLATGWRLLNYLQTLEVHRLKRDVLDGLVTELMAKHFRLATGGTRLAPGHHASRIFDEPLAAASTAVDLTLLLASSAASLAAALVLLAHLSLEMTLVLGLCVPALDRLARVFGAAVKAHADAEKEEEGLLRGFVSRSAAAARLVRIFELAPAVDRGLRARLDAHAERSFERVRATGRHNAFSAILLSHAEMLVIVLCGYEMMRGRMTFGGFMAFMSAFWTAAGSLRAITQRLPDLSKNEALVERIERALGAPEAPSRAPSAAGGASLTGVRFSHGDKTVLADLSLALGKSERVVLTGPNGGGKSTVTDLLAGFTSPDAGSVAAPARVSAFLTPQHFFPGTVREHLGYDELDAGAQRELDGLLADFRLDGALDSDPERLSAGQRQKVGLAMALSKDADLYLFDEPLANVDAASKEVVVARILERTRGRAVLMTLHGDEGFWTRFDRVVRLSAFEGGEGDGQGPRLIGHQAQELGALGGGRVLQ